MTTDKNKESTKGVNLNYQRRQTITIDVSGLPTCKQLGDAIASYGEKKLFSGSTDLGVTGVIIAADGNVQLALRHTNRE